MIYGDVCTVERQSTLSLCLLCLSAHPPPQQDTICLALSLSHGDDKACSVQALNHVAGLGEEQVLVLVQGKMQ